MLINPYNVIPSGMPKMLELLFNTTDDGAIVDSVGRHSPSLSPSGTRHVVGNKLVMDSGGFIRADAQNTSSSDFDFSVGDFSVECDVFVTADSAYIWRHTDNDSNSGLTLRLPFDSYRIIMQNDAAVSILSYTSPTSLVNTQFTVKVERISGRYALSINGTEVDTTSSVYTGLGGNGFIIGHLGSSGGITTIDNFIVRKS